MMLGLVRNSQNFPPALFGNEGELVMVRLSVEPRHLEDLLEALAGLTFPVNPELQHSPGAVAVEFPAYTTHVPEVKSMLNSCGFDPQSLQTFGVLQSRN
jgi:hypothetical protein